MTVPITIRKHYMVALGTMPYYDIIYHTSTCVYTYIYTHVHMNIYHIPMSYRVDSCTSIHMQAYTYYSRWQVEAISLRGKHKRIILYMYVPREVYTTFVYIRMISRVYLKPCKPTHHYTDKYIQELEQCNPAAYIHVYFLWSVYTLTHTPRVHSWQSIHQSGMSNSVHWR